MRHLRSRLVGGGVQGQFEIVASAALSPREVTVVSRMLTGQSLKQIAIEENLSAPTVSTVARKAMHQLGASSPGAFSPPLIMVLTATAHEQTSASGFPSHLPSGSVVSAEMDLVVPGGLTDAEKHFFWLTCGHAKLPAVASAAGCSKRTAANILASLFRKVDVAGRTALLASVARASLGAARVTAGYGLPARARTDF